ncbi:kinase-like domain-containing protein [Dendryphion nanum]|uniref:non-specific serine/threonine protein kinase n=1 Tax=Dendryphion nanum TaxID=256645 RepID=A0A9P9DUM7_9PLEO|nr:kinase-like domain-containing protein [Dendryphion nanum]
MAEDNDPNYNTRLEFIQDTLKKRFDLQELPTITPSQYYPKHAYRCKNFIYRIIFSSPPSPPSTLQPGCTPISPNTTTFIMRLANPLTTSPNSSKSLIENEVAMTTLASSALSAFTPSIVPQIYAWSSATSSDYGWTLQQLMPGKHLDRDWDSTGAYARVGQRVMLAQIASIVKALQDYELPESIVGFGDVEFDDGGRIVSVVKKAGEMASWGSFEEFYRERLERAIRKADGSRYIEGWRANGVRERLDEFMDRGLGKMFEGLEDREWKTIVHGDLTTENVMYDPETAQVTALLDWDSAVVLHPSYEFLRSFGDLGGELNGWYEEEAFSEQSLLREAKLFGFPPDAYSTQDQPFWDVAVAWEEELETHDVKRPRIMKGIEQVADVEALLRGVLPWNISDETARLRSAHSVWRDRRTFEDNLSDLLDYLGF